ncbi:MAG: DUF6067 family protein, partial [Planctomycetota bacterium]
EPQPTERVNPRTHWRYFMVRKTEQVRLESGEVQAVRFVGRRRPQMKKVEASHSALPPGNWRTESFDDSPWPRRRLPIMSTRHRVHSLLCARTQFRVADPAKLGRVTLSVDYRGGIAIYLNGAELARGHLPEGEIGPHALAKDYPKEAYLDPDGYLLRLGWRDPSTYKDRFALRDRHLRAVEVPADRLREGVNTLAVEVHRPPTDAVLFTGETRKYRRDQWCPWRTLGLARVTLACAGTDGLGPPPPGLHVDVLSTALRLYRDDGGDPCAELRPARIHGARNGAFSARLLVSAPGPIEGLAVAPEELRRADGAAIPADRVEIRYGLPDGPARRRHGVGTFDGLAPEPPETVPVRKGADRAGQPVWITVHVPEDARPGDYDGKVTVSARGADDVEVPLKLRVADWALPDPADFITLFELVQSPESLALQYEVPLWSEKHWELIDRSFELMGQLGAQTVYVPLFPRSCLGNPHGMIRWIRKGDGWEYDFGIFEKYVDTARRRLGGLKVVCVHAWPRRSGGAYFGQKKHKQKDRPFPFSVLDRETGKLSIADGPRWSDEDAAAFFKPVFDGIRARLKERGLLDAMMVGISHDVLPSKACVQVLAEASGGARWVMHCHPQRWSCHGQAVGYLAHVWGTRGPTLDPKRRRYGWKEKRLYATFPRAGSGTGGRIADGSPPLQYRVAPESAICAGIRGYGWIGADFWHVLQDKSGRGRLLFDRYPEYDRRGNLGLPHAFTRILRPGRRGPLASGRSEMVREGAQEAEARTFIERALHDPATKATLGGELAARCKEQLDRRLRHILRARSYWDELVWLRWEEQKGELYELAGEVARKLR